MKKDIEWLKREIPNLRGYAVAIDEIDGGLNPVTTISLKDVYRLINQLDEPEVTHEQVVEWIENNEFYCHATAETVLENAVDKGELGYYGTKYSVVGKPVIPKFVAEWIETHLEQGFDLYPVLKKLEDNSRLWTKGYNWYRENTLDFTIAYLTGEYKVEEEPLYRALIKGHELVNDYYIYWNCDKYDDDVFVSRLYPPHDNSTTELSKSEWNELGIDDSNADFVKVEEIEE